MGFFFLVPWVGTPGLQSKVGEPTQSEQGWGARLPGAFWSLPRQKPQSYWGPRRSSRSRIHSSEVRFFSSESMRSLSPANGHGSSVLPPAVRTG